jgi:4-hydroxythreonine-4-phosphate dehydrogenase
VDHGTALDLAGTGQAEHGSMIEAIRSAVIMAGHANGRRPGSNGATGSHPGHTHSGPQPPG